MGKSLTYEYIKKYVESRGYTLVSNEYINCKTKLVLMNKEGYLCACTFSSLQNGTTPNLYDKSNPYTLQNLYLWVNLNSKPFELLSGQEYNGADRKLKFKCLNENCREIFEISFNNIKNINQGCPYCCTPIQKVGLSNCLATTHPEISKQWHPTLNGNLTPFDITYGSNKKIWWQCLENNKHVWQASVHSRYDDNCPYCMCQFPSDNYNLLVCNPKICEEWDYNKNEKRPEEYLPNSYKTVWWQCINNPKHKWKAQIRNRNNGTGCPYCAHQLPFEDNNLLILNPDLCKEWNYERNNKLPEEYLPQSGLKVWWKCKECGHEWMSSICNRNGKNNRGCPKCSESKGEKQLDLILTKYNIPHDKEYTFDDLRGIGGGLLRFDVPVFWDIEKTQLKMLIEYDGIFHYEKQYDDDSFETLQIHDKLKNEYCKYNIKLLRIPYWDFDNIEEILIRELMINNEQVI